MHSILLLSESNNFFSKQVAYLKGKGFSIVGLCKRPEKVLKECAVSLPDVLLIEVTTQLVRRKKFIEDLIVRFPDIKCVGVSVRYELMISLDLELAGARAYYYKNARPEVLEKTIYEVLLGEKVFPENGQQFLLG